MPDLEKKGGQWIDLSTGKPASPELAAQAETHWAVQQAKTPAESIASFRPSTIGQGLLRNLPPLALQMGGETVGALAGAAGGTALEGGVPGPGTIAGGITGAGIGAGLGGVVSKHLPQRLGGSPEESNLHAFVLPAIMGAAGRGLPKAYEARQAAKVARIGEEAQKTFEEGAEKAGGEVHKQIGEILKPHVSQGKVAGIAQATGRQPYEQLRTSPQGQQESFQTRDAVLGPIDRMRSKFGRPIGEAYRNLKGDQRISEAEATDLADAAQGIKGDLISPAPGAAATLKKLQSYRPPPAGEAEDSTALDSELQGNPELAKAFAQWGAAEPPNPPPPDFQAPTLDELRELRQQVTNSLRTAQGGDIHALRDMQQALDQHLLPHLPPNIRAKFASYANFMTNYPWRDVRTLNRAGTPEQMSDWLFQGKSRQAREVIYNATPDERIQYRRMYADRLFRGVNDADTAEEQVAKLRANAKDDLQNGLIEDLYGKQGKSYIEKITHYPIRARNAAKIWNDPQVKQNWSETFLRVAQASGKADRVAAETAFRDLFQTLSPTEQKEFLQGLPPNFRLPAPSEPVELPSPRQAVIGHITNRANELAQLSHGLKNYAGPMAVGSVLTGSGFGISYGLGRGAVEGARVGAKKAMQWAVRHGAADKMSDAIMALAQKQTPTAAKAAFRLLVFVGNRMIHEHERNKELDNQIP